MATIKNYFVGIETDAKGCVSDCVKSTLDLKRFGDMLKKALVDYCIEKSDSLLDLYIYEADANGERAKKGGYVYNLDGIFYG